MEITTERIIFVTGNKICYNEKTGSLFSKTHVRFSALEAFSLTNEKLGCPIFAPIIIKILLFRAIEIEFQMKWINVFKQHRGFG